MYYYVTYKEDIAFFFDETNIVDKIKVFTNEAEAKEFIDELTENCNVTDIKLEAR